MSESAGGHADLSQKFFDQAAAELKKIGAGTQAPVGRDAISQAIVYNRAFLAAASTDEGNRRSAVKDLEGYLRSGDRSQAWWNLAYDRYTKLSQQLGQTAPSPDVFAGQRGATLRLVTELPLPGGIVLHLTDSLSDVLGELGPARRSRSCVRLICSGSATSIAASNSWPPTKSWPSTSTGPRAPPVPVESQGLGGKPGQLRIGMTEKELDDMLKSEANFQEPRPFTNPSVKYSFYRRLGLGISIDDGAVSEIIIAQTPGEQLEPDGTGPRRPRYPRVRAEAAGGRLGLGQEHSPFSPGTRAGPYLRSRGVSPRCVRADTARLRNAGSELQFLFPTTIAGGKTMFRGALIGAVVIGLVCIVTLSMIAAASPTAVGTPVAPPTGPATPPVAPPATPPVTTPVAPPATTPPAAAASAPTFVSLLQAANLAYTQPDKTQPSYHVMVESNGAATLVYCDEITPTWNYPDGAKVTIVHMYVQITPFYTQDIDPPAKFLRTALEEDNNNWFVFYTLSTNQKTGEWSVWIDTHIFTRGMTPEVLTDYLLILAADSAAGKDKLLPLMKTK